MPDTTWAALSNGQNSNLIRKTLAGGAAFIASYGTPAVETLTGSSATSALQALPTGYRHLGYLTEDGATFPRNIDTSDVNSWGVREPTRTDITRDESSCQIMLQETHMASIALYLGSDLAAPTANATTGEVVMDKPQTPAVIYYRLLVIGRDSTPNGDVYLGRFFPKAQLTDRADLNMGNGDDPIMYGLTFRAMFDDDEGTSERFMWGGPGWEALRTDMGFPAA